MDSGFFVQCCVLNHSQKLMLAQLMESLSESMQLEEIGCCIVAFDKELLPILNTMNYM